MVSILYQQALSGLNKVIPICKKPVICHAVCKGNVYKMDYSGPSAFKELIAKVVN